VEDDSMTALTMIRSAAALLAIGALGGLVMAVIRLSKKINPPSGLAMLHGLLAAAGATLLLYAAVMMGVPTLAQVGLAFLLIAAAGGVALNLKYHWERVLIPLGFMIAHALLAAIGFVLVFLVAFNGQ
jgi:glucose uptake protein GlcU